MAANGFSFIDSSVIPLRTDCVLPGFLAVAVLTDSPTLAPAAGAAATERIS